MLPRRAHHNRNARFVIKIPDSAVRTESRTVSCVVQPHKHRLNLQTAESCKGSGHLLHFAITGFGDRILDTIGLSLLGQHGAFERLTHVFCDPRVARLRSESVRFPRRESPHHTRTGCQSRREQTNGHSAWQLAASPENSTVPDLTRHYGSIVGRPRGGV